MSFYLRPTDIVEGQFFYENDMGMSVLYVALETPVHVDNATETGWKWNARSMHDGEIIDFFETSNSKYSAYRLNLSSEPEYMEVYPKLKKVDDIETDT